MNKNKTYWITKNGNKIDVDEMTVEHLRNALKMLIRNKAINKTFDETKTQILKDLKSDEPFF